MRDIAASRSNLKRQLRKKNKNKYMFAFCGALAALGHFREVQMSFLIVGHTHKDIDQKFIIFSKVLKWQGVLGLQNMLALVEEGAPTTDVTFTSVKLLENIWNWSQFITSHLYTEADAWTRTQNLHHFQFFMHDKP